VTAHIQTLCEHHRVAVRELREPAAGIESYVYTEWDDGRPVVAVLPYRLTAARELEICLANERVPCWKEDALCVVTCTWQAADPIDDAAQVLWDETGYRIHRDQVLSLGSCQDGKRSSTPNQLYAVDFTGLQPEDPVGDGSRLEAEAGCVWIGLQQLPPVRHPQAHTMVIRLLTHLAAAATATAADRSGRSGAPPWTAALQVHPTGGHEPGA
jgi:hypothetical protein